MCQMDSDMTYSEDNRSKTEDRVKSVDRQEEDRDNRKCCSGNRDAQYTAVVILHSFLAFKVSDPKDLV